VVFRVRVLPGCFARCLLGVVACNEDRNMTEKKRAGNFKALEVASLLDFIYEKKQTLFGSFQVRINGSHNV
jgi:hypothetical protein